MKSRSLRLLEKKKYKIVRVKEIDDRITVLFLKGFGNDEEFISLLYQDLIPLFRKVMQLNNGTADDLTLQYYGCSNFDECKPIIKISGKRFTRFLV